MSNKFSDIVTFWGGIFWMASYVLIKPRTVFKKDIRVHSPRNDFAEEVHHDVLDSECFSTRNIRRPDDSEFSFQSVNSTIHQLPLNKHFSLREPVFVNKQCNVRHLKSRQKICNLFSGESSELPASSGLLQTRHLYCLRRDFIIVTRIRIRFNSLKGLCYKSECRWHL